MVKLYPYKYHERENRQKDQHQLNVTKYSPIHYSDRVNYLIIINSNNNI